MTPVPTVPLVPKLPFTTPNPEHDVVSVELNENEEEFPVNIVDGEKGLRVTVGSGTQVDPFHVGAEAGHTLRVTDC